MLYLVDYYDRQTYCLDRQVVDAPSTQAAVDLWRGQHTDHRNICYVRIDAVHLLTDMKGEWE